MAKPQDEAKKKIIDSMTPKKAVQFFLVGLLWLLFSIPIVTMGPATCAAFYVGIKILTDTEEVNVWKSFLKGIKDNLKQGLLLSLVSVITLGGAGFLDYWVVAKSSQGIILILLAAGCSFTVIIFNLFAYPIIARYENTFSNGLRNAVALVLNPFLLMFARSPSQFSRAGVGAR